MLIKNTRKIIAIILAVMIIASTMLVPISFSGATVSVDKSGITLNSNGIGYNNIDNDYIDGTYDKITAVKNSSGKVVTTKLYTDNSGVISTDYTYYSSGSNGAGFGYSFYTSSDGTVKYVMLTDFDTTYNNNKEDLQIPGYIKIGSSYYRILGIRAGITNNTIRKISINGYISSIATSAFYGFSALSNISVNATNGNFASSNYMLFKKYDATDTTSAYCSVYCVPPNYLRGEYDTTSDTVANRTIAIPKSVVFYTYEDKNTLSSSSYNVTTLEEYCMVNCSKAKRCYLPTTLTTINYHISSDTTATVGYSPFSGTTSLLNFYLWDGTNDSTAERTDTSNAKFRIDDGVLYSNDYKTLYSYPSARSYTSYTVNEKTEVLAHHAFDGASNLTSIDLNNDTSTGGSRVRYFGQYAFKGCSKLTKISYAPQKYYYGVNNSTRYSTAEELITNALENGQVRKSTLSTPINFSLGYSQCLLLDISTDDSGNNAFKTAVQNWYSDLSDDIQSQVDKQISNFDDNQITNDTIKKIDDSNKTFLDVSELTTSKVYHTGTKNATDTTGGTYLSKSGKWSDEDKTQAQVAIDYVYGASLIGNNFIFAIDKTASMASTGEISGTNLGVTQSDAYPASRIYAQYSIVYNMTKGLVSNDKAKNSVSVITFSGDVDGEAYAKVLTTATGTNISNNMLVCDGTSGKTISNISNYKGRDYCVDDLSTVANYLNHIDLTASGSGTWYSHGLDAINLVLKQIEKDTNVSSKTLPVIFSSDGQPSDTETVIKTSADNVRASANSLYTVLEADLKNSDTASSSAKTAMGWVTNIEYNSDNLSLYKQYNKEGSDKKALTDAFEEIYTDTTTKNNTVIKDVINNDYFNFSGKAQLDVNKYEDFYTVAVTRPYSTSTPFSDKVLGSVISGSDYAGYWKTITGYEYLYLEDTNTGVKYDCNSFSYTGGYYNFTFNLPKEVKGDSFAIGGYTKTSNRETATRLLTLGTWNSESTFYINESATVTKSGTANVKGKDYEKHSYTLNLTSGTVLNMSNITCNICGEKYGDIFNEQKTVTVSGSDVKSVNQNQAYAYFGTTKGYKFGSNSYSGVTNETVEVHLPYTNYLDIYTLTLNLNLKTVNGSYIIGNSLDTNYDNYSNAPTSSDSYNGCFTYSETDSAISSVISGYKPATTTPYSVKNINNVETPVLSKTGGTFNIKIDLTQEYFNYSKATYGYTTEFADNEQFSIIPYNSNTSSVITASNLAPMTLTVSNGIATAYNLPQYYNGVAVKYTISRITTNTGKRFVADTHSVSVGTSTIANAVQNGDTLSYEYQDNIKKNNLEIKKNAYDNKVSNIAFKITATDSNTDDFGSYSKIVATNTSGVATISTLPIYDTGNKLIKYTVSELGIYNQDLNKYVIPTRYIVPDDQIATLNEDATTKLTLTFENKAGLGNIKIIKTSEDNITSGLAFEITGNDTSVIVATDENGTAIAENLLVYNSDGSNITYSIKELGTLKSGANVGSQNESDYEFPERYKSQEVKTTTISEPTTTVEVTFNNELIKGSITILKKSTKGTALENVGFVLVDHDKNIVPLSLTNSSEATYSKTGSTNYTLYTDSNGKISVSNLPILTNGKYYLKETKTLSGYNLLKDYVSIDDMTYANPNVTQTVYDSDKLNLPHTGGFNNMILISLLGAMLIMTAIIFFFFKQRRIKVREINKK
jgi:LPXTG-motif cell wall-anchored protein